VSGADGWTVDHGGDLSTDQVQRVLDTAVNPFVLLDLRGYVAWASDSIEELLGYAPADLVGRPMIKLIAPESREDALAMMADALDERGQPTPAPSSWEGVGPVLELLRADGTTTCCAMAAATPARTGIEGFVLQLRRANAHAALEEVLLSMGTGQPLDTVLAQVASVLAGELPDAAVTLFRTDRETKHLEPVQDATGLCDGLHGPIDIGAPWTKASERPGTIVEVAVDDLPEPLRGRAVEAGFRWLVLMAIEPLTEEDDAPPMVTAWSRVEHRMHRLNHDRLERCGRLFSVALSWEWGRRAVEWAATHDLLTGLHNRAAFLAHFESATRSRGRRQEDHVAVLYLDLDDFKPVNDDHGHALGDQVLVEVAARLRRAVRPTDVVARLGGDEFAVLCPGVDDLPTVAALAERLVEEVRAPVAIGSVRVRVGLSVGIALVDDEDDGDTVLHRADGALRAAKLEGKGRWRVA
jgi:diguanylate cyclase (GGDEF)-like protein/PAS domain S-box-containing protein